MLYDSPYDNFFMGKAKLFLGVPDIAEQLYWRHKQALIYFTWQQVETLMTLLVFKFCWNATGYFTRSKNTPMFKESEGMFFSSSGDLYTSRHGWLDKTRSTDLLLKYDNAVSKLIISKLIIHLNWWVWTSYDFQVIKYIEKKAVFPFEFSIFSTVSAIGDRSTRNRIKYSTK